MCLWGECRWELGKKAQRKRRDSTKPGEGRGNVQVFGFVSDLQISWIFFNTARLVWVGRDPKARPGTLPCPRLPQPVQAGLCQGWPSAAVPQSGVPQEQTHTNLAILSLPVRFLTFCLQEGSLWSFEFCGPG